MKEIICDRCGYREKLGNNNSIEKMLITKDVRKRIVKSPKGDSTMDYVHMYDMELCPDCQEKLQEYIGVWLNERAD